MLRLIARSRMMATMFTPKPKCRDANSIDFLIASRRSISCSGRRRGGDCRRGMIVPLEGFGSIRVFKVVPGDGDIEYGATNDLAMDEVTRRAHAEQCWGIENHHRGLRRYRPGGGINSRTRSHRPERM